MAKTTLLRLSEAAHFPPHSHIQRAAHAQAVVHCSTQSTPASELTSRWWVKVAPRPPKPLNHPSVHFTNPPSHSRVDGGGQVQLGLWHRQGEDGSSRGVVEGGAGELGRQQHVEQPDLQEAGPQPMWQAVRQQPGTVSYAQQLVLPSRATHRSWQRQVGRMQRRIGRGLHWLRLCPVLQLGPQQQTWLGRCTRLSAATATASSSAVTSRMRTRLHLRGPCQPAPVSLTLTPARSLWFILPALQVYSPCSPSSV